MTEQTTLSPRRLTGRAQPAPTAGAWWFHDSPEGMRRFREQPTGTAGLHNTTGFVDDARAYDLARRTYEFDRAEAAGTGVADGAGAPGAVLAGAGA